MITIYNNSVWLVYVPDVTMLSHVSALSSSFRHLPDEAQKTIVLVGRAKVQSFDGTPCQRPSLLFPSKIKVEKLLLLIVDVDIVILIKTVEKRM